MLFYCEINHLNQEEAMNIRIILLSLSLLLSYQTSFCQEEISVEDIWRDYKFTAKRVPGFNFLNDGKHYTKLESNSIIKYSIVTGQRVSTLLNGDSLEKLDGDISSYSFSNDESLILLETNKESIYRRSSKAFTYVYNSKLKTLLSVFDDDKIMSPIISPNNKYVAYGWNNNLYYLDIESGETNPVTMDGGVNMIINGICDWVYEEEFGFTKAFFWSPDSKKIAYIRFDESAVEEFTMTNYTGESYPEYVTFKYPKVGEENAKVSTHVFHLTSEKTITADVGSLEDQYIPRIKWANNAEQLCVFKMNRLQNHIQLFLTDVESGKSNILLEEKNKYYIDITDDLTFLKSNKQFIWSSEKSGFNHLYLYDFHGNEIQQLTKGDYDVTGFYGVDEKNNTLFYQAAEYSPMDRHVYQIGLNGKSKQKLTNKTGTNSAQFSSTYDYFTWTNSTISSPPTYEVVNRNAKPIRSLESNDELKRTSVAYPTAEFFNFKTSENIKLNGYMIKPNDFDSSKSYPVLMYVYGGPGSQTVTNSWKGQNYWWFQLLAQKGYIVVSVDNRGTGARGEEFKKTTYLTLGKHETTDQIEAAKYLGSLPYIDAERIGIFGWSYGGFMASHCILQGNDVFDTAIAVAPVTNWKWYDTIYTERFMRTDKENESGYDENSPIYYADQLKGSYLLVHGNSDDNVHFQNSAEMAAALIKANKQFDTYFYPNRNHGIYGDNARLHLYTKMTDFILENL